MPAALAGLAGVAVGSVWNYAVSSVFTWKQNKIQMGTLTKIYLRATSSVAIPIRLTGTSRKPQSITNLVMKASW